MAFNDEKLVPTGNRHMNILFLRPKHIATSNTSQILNLPRVCGFAFTYSRTSSFHPNASSSLTTPRTTATPLFFSSVPNSSDPLPLARSAKRISGTNPLPRSLIIPVSSRSCARSLSQLARSLSPWPRMRLSLRAAKRGGGGGTALPERETKTAEMSPSGLGGGVVVAA